MSRLAELMNTDLTVSSEAGVMDTYQHVTRIAKVCHSVNKAYSEAVGESAPDFWENLTTEVVASIENGVVKVLDNPGITPEESHQNWVDYKTQQGWTYGISKDALAKTHPLLKPYEELSLVERMKDILFINVVLGFL